MRDETLWARLLATDLLSVNDLKLPSGGPFGGKPLSNAVKLEIIAELRRFLYLLAVSRESLVPSHFRRARPAKPTRLACCEYAATYRLELSFYRNDKSTDCDVGGLLAHA